MDSPQTHQRTVQNHYDTTMLSNHFLSESVKNLLQDPYTLAILPFSASCKPQQAGIIESGLTQLSATTLNEVWRVATPSVRRGKTGRCIWNNAGDIQMVALWLSPEECLSINTSTEKAYLELLDFNKISGFAHPFRFWNYLPQINKGEADSECYKQFCNGRLEAFKKSGISETEFPAASALGHHTEGAVIYLLAAKHTGDHHNNSLQVNAYNYPREYGPSSPSFSRATTLKVNDKNLFFISGTASITGHQTVAEGNLDAQLNTTCANIQHLLQTIAPNEIRLQTMKVYLRHSKDYNHAQSQLTQLFPQIPMLFVQADICRNNLLVEIECFCA
jgi:chorismate lyase/3-hydroxybenzoate synthase